MSRILVTGGAGFIGSHVVDLFIEQGYEVAILDDLSTGRKSNLNPKAKFYKMDLRSDHVLDVFSDFRPEYISHHAAQMNVRVSLSSPLHDAEINIMAVLKLLELCRIFDVKHFIHISSSAVYGEPVYLPCDENHPINPLCGYGVSKHTIEHYLYLNRLNHGLEYTVFRYPNVYGPRQDPQGEAGVVAQFLNKMLHGEKITIHGNGLQTRDFVYVSDIAQANYLAIIQPHESGIYNLGSGSPTSIVYIFHCLSQLTGYNLAPVHDSAIKGETQNIYLDSSKAYRDFRWYSSPGNLMPGLENTVQYFKENERS